MGRKKGTIQRPWTEEEVRYAIENYEADNRNNSIQDIAKSINKTFMSVKNKLIKEGILKQEKRRTYSEKEISFIKENYIKMPVKEISKVLNISENAVRGKAQGMGLRRGGAPKWSDKDIEILEKHYEDMPLKDISLMLERDIKNLSEISDKACRIGLKKVYKWTDEEEDIIRALYPKGEKEEILSKLKSRSWDNIINKAGNLGVRREIQPWTKEEDNTILENWKNLEDFQLLELLPRRTQRSIKWRRQELGLQRKIGSTIGTAKVSKGGDACHSLDECKLLNYIFDKSYEYKKDVPYREIISNDNSHRTCDVCVYNNGIIYAIEYFGLYRYTPRTDIEIKYVEKMAYKYDSFMFNEKENVVFIPLYPDDIGKRNSRKMKRIIDNLFEEEN